MYVIEELYKDIKENDISLEKIYKKYGGFQFYIPKVDPKYEEKVFQEFNGYNHLYLATKYNVTPRTIRDVITRLKKRKK